ncbi:hypothetical protein V6N13_093097 [Hibiscus sabdariffa]|uniref:Uncharacterized protein n=2 Tax=Hibiscus sabdariffa TaxID=183260 RepID=A0ABR2ASD4_9ROSI
MQVLIDCSGEEGTIKTPDAVFLNKKNALLKLPKQLFSATRKVENVLTRFGRKGTHVRVLPFHAALAQETRLINMKESTHSQPGEESLILVCTHRYSLYVFYVCRVGRTARGGGGTGKAFVFVVGKQVPLARKIFERNQKGHPLHEVPAAFRNDGFS